MEDPPDEGEGWLVSYADMMTLIACFFILMTAFANFESVGFNDKAEKISKAFRKDKFKSSIVKRKFIQEDMTKYNEQKETSKISLADGSVVVTYSSSVLFANGERDLKGNSLDTVDSMIDIIRDNNPTARILVEGHADDIVEGKDENWSLSAERAVFLAKRFEVHGFPMENISVLAKGNSDPLKKSISFDGQRLPAAASLNRRVIIRVLIPKNKDKLKMGFGIYFKDSRGTESEDYTKSVEDGFDIDSEQNAVEGD